MEGGFFWRPSRLVENHGSCQQRLVRLSSRRGDDDLLCGIFWMELVGVCLHVLGIILIGVEIFRLHMAIYIYLGTNRVVVLGSKRHRGGRVRGINKPGSMDWTWYGGCLANMVIIPCIPMSIANWICAVILFKTNYQSQTPINVRFYPPTSKYQCTSRSQ